MGNEASSEVLSGGGRMGALMRAHEDDDRRRIRDAGFDAHLVKPADFSQIQQALGG